MKIHGIDGKVIDAEVTISTGRGFHDITFESRSSKPRRNSQYNDAVSTVLKRLAACNFKVSGVFLASSKYSKVPENNRLVLPPNYTYPILMDDVEHEALRLSVGRAISKMFREPLAKGGGNAQRRMTIRVLCNGCDPEKFQQLILLGLIGIQAPSDQGDIEGISFDPTNVEDTRKKQNLAITIRRGQKQFRNRLLEAYNYQCAITGSRTEAVLEAAHIIPYRGPQTDFPSNGLLLRSDIHTLYDLGYITITQEFNVNVSEELRGSEYWKFNGKGINLPEETHLRPSKAALAMRAAEATHPF